MRKISLRTILPLFAISFAAFIRGGEGAPKGALASLGSFEAELIRAQTLLVDSEAERKRVVLDHLQQGIFIADSEFNLERRKFFMKEWIQRSRGSSLLGLDPLSTLVRSYLADFDKMLDQPRSKAPANFQEISGILKTAKSVAEAQ